jgi:hypothetical protein
MLEERQEEELRKLNRLIVSQSIQDKQIPSNKKMFNPQTGEMTLWVDNGNFDAKLVSVNLFE